MFLLYSLFQNLLCDRLLTYLETLKKLQMVGNGMMKAINLSSVLVYANPHWTYIRMVLSQGNRI